MYWEIIPGYTSERILCYEASSDGLYIRSRTLKGHISILTQHKKSGYFNVKIAKQSVAVHILVAKAHIPRPPEADHTWSVDHIDPNDKSNNSIQNLRWASKKMQRENQRNTQRVRIDSCPVIATAVEDIYVDVEGKRHLLHVKDTVLEFSSYNEAKNLIACIDPSTITKCLQNKIRQHAGFTWKTPPELPNLSGEIWKIVGENTMYRTYVSTHGRIGYLFSHGYFKKISSEDKSTSRHILESDAYPTIGINKKKHKLHNVIWTTFVGEIPSGYIVDHIDNVKQNASLSNLQLKTFSENTLKAHDDGCFKGTITERRS